jgi:hypothetical protein
VDLKNHQQQIERELILLALRLIVLSAAEWQE